MANKARRLAHNVSGDFFVDSTCIDCDQCREIAPATFRDAGGAASVYRQPSSSQPSQSQSSSNDLRRALMALVTCPVGSIGAEQRHKLSEAVASFPEQIEDNVYFCGFSSSRSYGASSYLIVLPEGNLLVDSPRFAARLVQRLEQMGGIRWMFLSHVDDIADHARFRRHFGCERIIHRLEVHPGISDIERQIAGDEPQSVGSDVGLDLVAIPTPGHTRGHMVLLYRKRFLFTGDHMGWSPEHRRLSASRAYCWYSWEKQTDSMERLLGQSFEWVLPGHGRRHHASAPEMHESLARCVARMRQS